MSIERSRKRRCGLLLLSHIKEWNNVICSNVDGPRGSHTLVKLHNERQTTYDITYMWNLKRIQMNSPAEPIKTHRLWKQTYRSSRLVEWKQKQVSMRTRSLTLLSRSVILCCHELRWRTQMWFVSGIAAAVVQANNCSSNSPPSLGTSTCRGWGPKKKKKKRKEKKRNSWLPKGTGVGEGRNEMECGICIWTLWYMEWLANGDLLYRIENSTQYSIIFYTDKELGKRICVGGWVCVYKNWNHFAVQQK